MPSRKPLALVDLYVDDFIRAAQTPSQATQVQWTSLWSILYVFWSDDDKDINCKEPISESKLAKSDMAWSMQKALLGW